MPAKAFLRSCILDNWGMQTFVIDPSQINDISQHMLDDAGDLRVVPAHVLQGTSKEERMLFGVRRGLYSFPTVELCDFLKNRIQGRSALEIGAGHGALAKSLGIRASDNHQQNDPQIKAYYDALGQTTVPYGAHVENLDAMDAVRKHQPEVVIACWVTHRFDPARPGLGGNAMGVDEAKIIDSCDEYIFIGNERVHKDKPIWALPHEKITPPWLYSRAGNGSADFIGIWSRSSRPG